MSQPIIALRGLTRVFPAGDGQVVAMKDLTLDIAAGEMVAIMGASGSGKSTLMNILGCLDRPTSGAYRIAGRETKDLDADALSRLRREYFGFVFQRYHLLPELSAAGNVEIPAIYAGQPAASRRRRAYELLERLGMADRLGHQPNQLSGGQQQRVSIARALMNGANIIFADEPTGALDSKSGAEVLGILEELNREGKTIIIVTHNANVASHARRIIELKDGEVISDRPAGVGRQEPSAASEAGPQMQGWSWRVAAGRLREAFQMAVISMSSHKLRTALTMLGIVIGIASVISILGIGNVAKDKVLSDISGLGTNTIEIFPGKDLGDVKSTKVETLVVDDARALAEQPYVAAVTPTVSTSNTIRHGPLEASALINGVGEGYFGVKGTKLALGRFFDAADVRDIRQDIMVDQKTADTFFADDPSGPLGKVILVGKVPCRIVGVTQQQQGGFGSSQNLSVYLPYTTVQARFLGSASLRSIVLRVDDGTISDDAQAEVTSFLLRRHLTKDFVILNTDDIRRTISSVTGTLALMIAAIAAISLVVGGIGVMNIMLVTVSERIGEIGVRMAVGARRSDILQQFLIEAVMVCLLGGALGVAAAFGLGAAFNALVPSYQLTFSAAPIALALLCSTGIGVVFGFVPARRASVLDPLAALSRD